MSTNRANAFDFLNRLSGKLAKKTSHDTFIIDLSDSESQDDDESDSEDESQDDKGPADSSSRPGTSYAYSGQPPMPISMLASAAIAEDAGAMAKRIGDGARRRAAVRWWRTARRAGVTRTLLTLGWTAARWIAASQRGPALAPAPLTVRSARLF